MEKRIDSRLDSKYRLFSTSVDELKERHRDIETHISKLERRSPSSSSHSSLVNKVNYFVPGSGAIINPIKSSPKCKDRRIGHGGSGSSSLAE